MTRRPALFGFLLALTLLGAPLAVTAQFTSSVKIPACDVVTYELQKKGTNPKEVRSESKTAEQYAQMTADERAQFDIVNVDVTNPCGIQHFVQLFANLAAWGFSVLMVIALFFFIWGGFILLISAGRADYVQNGKKILSGTVLGTLIVLISWVLVSFFINAFTGSNKGLIFPNTPFAKEGLTGAQGCRAKSKKVCKGPILSYGCVDPVSADGAVSQLQNQLINKGCDCGPEDGCFGPQTSRCVQDFLIVNGIAPSSNDLAKVAVDANLINGLAKDSKTQSCKGLKLPVDIDPSIQPSEPPSGPSDTYCCVPRPETFYPCIDGPGALCPVDIPATDLDPVGFTPGYAPLEGSCQGRSECDTGFCMEINEAIRGQRNCSSTVDPNSCGAGEKYVRGSCTNNSLCYTCT